MTKPKPANKTKPTPKPKATSTPRPKVEAEPKAKKPKLEVEPKRKSATPPPAAPRRAPRPRAVAAPDEDLVIDTAPDQPFEEGAHDVIGPDLRHRMISEAAYYRYALRGYADGYDIDDWVAAEEEVDHLLLNPPSDTEPAASQ